MQSMEEVENTIRYYKDCISNYEQLAESYELTSIPVLAKVEYENAERTRFALAQFVLKHIVKISANKFSSPF